MKSVTDIVVDKSRFIVVSRQSPVYSSIFINYCTTYLYSYYYYYYYFVSLPVIYLLGKYARYLPTVAYPCVKCLISFFFEPQFYMESYPSSKGKEHRFQKL